MTTRTHNENISLEGMINFCQAETGRRLLDFACYEAADVAPFRGEFTVQRMRNGNIYMTEHRTRTRNTPIFRDDNSTVTVR